MLHARNRLGVTALFILFFTLTLTEVWSERELREHDFRCHVCHKKVQRGYNVKGQFYCPAHLDSALPHCSHCEKAIKGNYRLVGPGSVPVCPDCHQNYEKCFICTLPVDGAKGGVQLGDGRHLCREHRKSGIRSQGTARRIFNKGVSETIATLGTIMRLEQPIKTVKLVDLHGLRSVEGHGQHSAALASGKVLGLTSLTIKTQGEKRWTQPAVVHLLDNVPRERMLTVSIHEYTHAWHAENHSNYSQTNQEMREGFAEWVAYKVCQAYGRDKQIVILMNPRGGVYYTGLKKFLALERKLGVEGVLEFATTATEF